MMKNKNKKNRNCKDSYIIQVEMERNVREYSYIHFQSFFTFAILIPLTL